MKYYNADNWKWWLLIKFGDWGLFLKFPSEKEAKAGLVYWQNKVNWPLKIAHIKE